MIEDEHDPDADPSGPSSASDTPPKLTINGYSIEEWLVAATMGVLFGLLLFTYFMSAIRELTTPTLGTIALVFYAVAFVYFMGHFKHEAPMTWVAPGIFFTFMLAAYFVADTPLRPSIPVELRFRNALLAFITGGVLLWVFFGAVVGPGFPRPMLAAAERVRSRLNSLTDRFRNLR